MKKLFLPLSIAVFLCSCGGGTPSSSSFVSSSEESASPSLPSSSEEFTSPSLSPSSEESSASGEKTPLECYNALLNAASSMERNGAYHYIQTTKANSNGQESSRYVSGAIDRENKQGFLDDGNTIALFDGGAPECPITYRHFNNIVSARYSGQDAIEDYSLNSNFQNLTPADSEHADGFKVAFDVATKFSLIEIVEDAFSSCAGWLSSISSTIVTGELEGRYGFRYTSSIALYDSQDDQRYLTATLIREAQYETDFIYLFKNNVDLSLSFSANEKAYSSSYTTCEIEKGFNQTHYEQLKQDYFASIAPSGKQKIVLAASGILALSLDLSEDYFGKSVPVNDLLSLLTAESEGKFTATALYEDEDFTKPIIDSLLTSDYDLVDIYFDYDVNEGYAYIETWHDSGQDYAHLFDDEELAYIRRVGIDLTVEGLHDYEFVTAGEPYPLQPNPDILINDEPYEENSFTPGSQGKYTIHYGPVDEGSL